MQEIEAIDSCSREFFESEIVPAHKPVLLKGVCADWPMVRHGQVSDGNIMDYLCQRSTPGGVRILEAPSSSRGRFFYSEDWKGFNFQRKVTSFDHFADRLSAYSGSKDAPVLSIQSAFMDEYFHGLSDEHFVELLPRDVKPRIWIGNRTVVATHYDDAENIACVAAGERRFTLFPPDQISNLYIGPLDNTPAGAPVSMASLTPPEVEQFPKLEVALRHAYTADLEPGDGIYIPTLWWHHVEALSDINVLVNFWSGGAIGGKGGPMPLDSLLMALLTIRSRPEPVRKAWRAFFDHYIFDTDIDPVAHLPVGFKGILGGIDDKKEKRLKEWLVKQLSR